MAKKWSDGGPNPLPRWAQWVAFYISDGVQFVGAVALLALFAAGLTHALTGTVQLGVFVSALLVVGTLQLFMWVIGDEIRNEIAARKTSPQSLENGGDDA